MRTMKTLCAALVLSLIAGVVLPAAADIVEVSTSVTMPATVTDDDVKDAVWVAAQEALSSVSPLEPAMMVVTAAYLNAGRLYVRFLIADEVGARLLGVTKESPEAQTPWTSDPHALRI